MWGLWFGVPGSEHDTHVSVRTQTLLEVETMGLLKRIDEAIATARYNHGLSARYAASVAKDLTSGAVEGDRIADSESPTLAA
jgi:hypothetical protein